MRTSVRTFVCSPCDDWKCFWVCSVPPGFVGYSIKLFLLEVATEISQMLWGLEIVLAKGPIQKCGQQKTLALKQLLCAQRGQSSQHVGTNNPFHFLPTETLIGSEECGKDPHCLLSSCVLKFCYQYFLIRVRITKCFTKSSKRFRCEIMLENANTFCSWIHQTRTCRDSKQLLRAEIEIFSRCHKEHGRLHYKREQLLISILYRRMCAAVALNVFQIVHTVYNGDINIKCEEWWGDIYTLEAICLSHF